MTPARPVALITGASSGIGEAFTRILAAKKHDLVVVARREDRLNDLAKELTSEFGIDVEVIAADLSTTDGQNLVAERLSQTERRVSLLINNAGYGTGGQFHTLDLDGELDEIRTNLQALVVLSHAALGQMVPAGDGAILNVSSVVGFIPWPGAATYAATKAYAVSFTESISEELRGSGVRVMALCPGPVRTEFQERMGLNTSSIAAFEMSAYAVAQSGLRALKRGEVVHIAGVRNWWAVAQRYAPRFVVRRSMGLFNKSVARS